MTLLEIIEEVSKQIGLPTPTQVVGNTDVSVKQLLAFANHEGKQLRSLYRWPELTKEHTFTLVTDTASYALPEDFDHHINETAWDRTNQWPLVGPVTAQHWQFRKSGITTVTPRKEFRVKGWSNAQFFVNTTPDSDDNGDTFAFEYSSLTWVRPVAWAASTTFAADAYCSYNENIYQTSAGGVTGATAPTHTSGSASDDSVTWTYVSDAYQTFIADTDVPILSSQLILLGTRWRYLQQKGLPEWQFVKQEYETSLRRETGRLQGARRVSIAPAGIAQLISPASVPDTGFGS